MRHPTEYQTKTHFRAALLAATLCVSGGAVVGQSLSSIQLVKSVCSNPNLSHEQVTTQLTNDGWRQATSNKEMRRVAQHGATGMAYRASGSWKGTAQNMRAAFVRLAKQKQTPSPMNKTVTQSVTLFSRADTFDGFLIVDDFAKSHAGAASVIGRECHFNFEDGAAADGLQLAAGRVNADGRQKLPNITVSANGQNFGFASYVKSLPEKGLGLKTDSTKFLSTRLSR